ncbi:MAG: lysophospholipid acyltransferase family protein [Candidatus Dormibacteria bacterium]
MAPPRWRRGRLPVLQPGLPPGKRPRRRADPLLGRLFRAGGRASALLPPGVRYGLARAGGTAGYGLLPGLRRQALQNYAGILHLAPDSPAVRRVAREAIVGYSKLIADFLALSELSREDVMRMVDWRGWEHIQAGLAEGKGIIVVTPHFGNWDMAAAAAAARGLKVTAVTDRYGNEDLNTRVTAARERFGIRVVPLTTSAARAVLAALRRNEVAALVCDLAKEGRNVEVLVCGQKARVPAGPAVLALRSGAPVVPVMCRRQADNRYLLEVQPPIDTPRTGDQEVDTRVLAQAIMDRFEPELLRLPEQWYLFSPMWLGEPGPRRPGVAQGDAGGAVPVS